jgi:type II secretory pathway component PulF
MRGRRDWLVIVLGIVAALLIGVALFLLLVICPKMGNLYEEIGVEGLPTLTLVFLGASHFLTSKWWVVALLLLGGGALVALLKRTARGRTYWGLVFEQRPVLVWATASAATAGLVAVPLVAYALFLPLVGITAQLAAP